MYCINADQPERRANLMLLPVAGNSIRHNQYGDVVDYNQCQDIIKHVQNVVMAYNVRGKIMRRL